MERADGEPDLTNMCSFYGFCGEKISSRTTIEFIFEAIPSKVSVHCEQSQLTCRVLQSAQVAVLLTSLIMYTK